MKWLLIIAFYCVNPGEPSDVNIRIYPKDFQTLEECKLIQDLMLKGPFGPSGIDKHNVNATCVGTKK